MKLKNIIMREIFPHLKLKDTNISFLKNIHIYASILAQVFIIITVCLYMLLPYIAKNTYKASNITFYEYENSNDQNTSHYFDKIKEELSKNKLYTDDINIDFYLLNDKYMYKIFNPIEWLPNRQTFGVTHNKSIFMKHINIHKNKAYAYFPADSIDENLDAVLVHEAVHTMQNHKYGWFYTSFNMPYWVKEGYPIYSARALSIYTEKWLIDYLINKDTDIESWAIFSQDQFYGLLVKHAIEKMNKSVDDLHLGKVAYDEVLQSLFKEYNITKEKK